MSPQQMLGKREMPIAETVRMIDSVNYQEGSWSAGRSSTARREQSHCSPSMGQSLSEHTVAYGAVAHLLEGDSEITVAGTALRATAGEADLMPANQRSLAEGA
jgi:hypothetical protein